MNSLELDEDEVEIVDYYQSQLTHLFEVMREIASEWQAHFDRLQRRAGIRSDSAFHLPSTRPHGNTPGRPKFETTKEQLHSSLSFSWLVLRC